MKRTALAAGLAVLASLAALVATSCTKPADRPAASGPGGTTGAGRRVAEGPAQGLRASADGTQLAWLARCARAVGQAMPQAAMTCDLLAAPVLGGEPVRVASGVSSLDGGFGWGADGTLVAVADHDPARGAGTLVAFRPGSAPRPLASSVSFWAFGPGGVLGLVTAGELKLAPPGGEPAPVRGASGVATFEFHPSDAGLLLARRRAAAGGEILAIAGGAATALGTFTIGDYGWSPDGRFFAATVRGAGGAYDLRLWRTGQGGKGATLGTSVQGFSFSRDASALAFRSGVAPGRSGDLQVVSLAGVEDPSTARPVTLARSVGEFHWAPGAPRLAWLEEFDPRIRAGVIGTGGPGAPRVTYGKNVTAYDLSPSGAQVAFLEHVTAGGYSVDLRLSPTGAAEAGTVARGVFGFDFSPDGRWLYYRTACVRNAEACDLYRIPATGLAPGQSPERIAEGVKSFEFDRERPGRLLVSFARMDMAALDLAVYADGKLATVDRMALAGSAILLPPDGKRLAWIGVSPKGGGVFVADVP